MCEVIYYLHSPISITCLVYPKLIQDPKKFKPPLGANDTDTFSAVNAA